MANKVSIFIENTNGRHFELTNSKMSIMLAKDYDVNWSVVFQEKVNPYDIIISDFRNSKASAFGLGYTLVEHCDDEKLGRKIIEDCRNKLKEQYDRLMEIRVAKKYDLNPLILSKIELEFHSSENYEINLNDYFNEEKK